MWKPYLLVVAKKAAQAIHVLNRFHIASHLTKAIDEVRAARFWRDAGVPMPLAITLTLAVALTGGGLNALLIGRLGYPPLIVPLGPYSLFRGAAEGLTRGIENYSGFPASFLHLGQGYAFGVLPAQLVLLAGAASATGFWLHRTGHGRSL